MKISILSVLVLVIAISIFTGLGGCSRNVDEIKLNAERIFAENNFNVIGYQGYLLSAVYGGTVWYTLKKQGYVVISGITYQAALIKWFDEYHIYNLEAIDAIRP